MVAAIFAKIPEFVVVFTQKRKLAFLVVLFFSNDQQQIQGFLQSSGVVTQKRTKLLFEVTFLNNE